MAEHEALDRLIAAEQDERRRIALFLHDGPVQQLAGIALMLDATAHLIATTFGAAVMNANPFQGPQEALPLFIFKLLTESAQGNVIAKAWTGCLVLMLMVLVLFPWGSIAPPYHFTEHLNNWGSYILVGIILFSGTMLNAMLTQRMWLIAGWLSFFALQAVLRGYPLRGLAFPLALRLVQPGEGSGCSSRC